MRHLTKGWAALVSKKSSWRPVSHEHWPDHFDAAIILDRYGHSGTRYSVWTYGHLIGVRHSFEEATALVEDVYGPLDWWHYEAPPVEKIHYYFGPTTEFTEPVGFWAIEELPRLG